MTYAELQTAITSAHRAGNFRLADDLETDAQQRCNAALDRWADEASDNTARASDHRKYGNFYGARG